MIKTNHWVNALFALIAIVVPAFIGFYFLLPDWNKNVNFDYWIYWVISFAYIGYVLFISFLSIVFKMVGYDSLRFNIPIALVMIAIFVSFDWHIALRVLFSVTMILIAWPMNVFVDKIKENYYEKRSLKKRDEK